MEVVAQYYRVVDRIEIVDDNYEDVTKHYQMLKCPACNEITIQTYKWCDLMDPEDVVEEIIYPSKSEGDIPDGLPENIKTGLSAAQKVKSIDANAYAVLIGRVLELVCVDRKAEGSTLANQMQDLAKKGEIPDKLVMVAKNLRDFRNIGAHATLGALSNKEVPILTALCNAVLEYVYTAPYLANQAERRVSELKKITRKKI